MPVGAPDYFKRIMLYGVDEDGNLVAGLVDADGRFVMIPTDAEDPWGQKISHGLGELAAVLTPVHRYDRRGQVVHWESFSCGLGGVKTETSGTGASIAASDARWRTGGYSAKLTAGSTAGNYCRIYDSVPLLAASRAGVEFSFTDSLYQDWITLEGYMAQVAASITFGLRYRREEHDLSYYDETGSWQVIREDIYLTTDDRVFHTMKLVWDLDTSEYVRWMLDNLSGTFSPAEGYPAGGTTLQILRATITFRGAGGGSAISYLDDLIFTQQEP